MNRLPNTYTDTKHTITLYLSFFVPYWLLLTYQSKLGLKYIIYQFEKPKFNLALTGNADYENELKDQEQEFEDWNIYMRLKLEKYYRISIVVSVSVLIINILILCFIGRYWGTFYYSATVLESI